jgi:hypothetical protein
VHVVRHKGANVASWNLANYEMTRQDGKVFVDDEPLLFFHFHHLKRRRAWLFETDFAPHGARWNRVLKEDVFTPYFRLLDEQAAAVASVLDHSAADPLRPITPGDLGFSLRTAIADFAAGNLLLYVGGRVL